jgi:carbon monoxide dehydrogenase subunit G
MREQTMFKVEHSVVINRSMQDVFDFIIDPARMHEWGGSDMAEWVTESPPGLGSERRSTGNFLGRKLETISEITVWNPPVRYDFKSGGPIDAELTHMLESVNGGTQLNVSGNIELGGLFKMAEPLLKGQVDKRMETDLGAIKLILEAEAA